MYSSVALSTLTLLGSHPYLHVQNFFIFLKWNTIPIKYQLLIFPFFQPPEMTILLSVSEFYYSE